MIIFFLEHFFIKHIHQTLTTCQTFHFLFAHLIFSSSNFAFLTFFGTYASMLPRKGRTFPSVSGKNRKMPKHQANQISDVNMNLSQLSENLQCAEMVIRFCQEKNLIGKIKSCRTCEHPYHLKKNEEKLCLEMQGLDYY